MKTYIHTFLLAYVQVALIAVNTWQIANAKIMGAVVVGFLISLVWSFNVRRVSICDWKTRIIYCTGAALGTASGLLATTSIYS